VPIKLPFLHTTNNDLFFNKGASDRGRQGGANNVPEYQDYLKTLPPNPPYARVGGTTDRCRGNRTPHQAKGQPVTRRHQRPSTLNEDNTPSAVPRARRADRPLSQDWGQTWARYCEIVRN
jgi:hypothetical protein